MRYLLLASLVLLGACAKGPRQYLVLKDISELPTIQQAYAERLSKVDVGMSIDEFKQIFPEAYIGGQNKDLTAYELVKQQRYVVEGHSRRLESDRQLLWFYFYKNQLASWGRPWDWPERADLIIEHRND